MNRAQNLWLQSIIAFGGAGYWITSPHLPYYGPVGSISIIWAWFLFLTIWMDTIEDWLHRVSSFMALFLITIEGILGLLGLGGESTILLLAVFHGFIFLLAVVGRYQSQLRKTPRRALGCLTEEALADIPKSPPPDSL